MQALAPTIALLKSWIDQLTAFLGLIPEEFVLLAAIIPIVLTLFARSVSAFLGVLLLSAAACALALDPSAATPIIVVATYIGSLVLALSVIRARRRTAAIEAELASMRSELNGLVEAEQRHLMIQLKSNPKTGKTDDIGDKRTGDSAS
jgi:hypothetical protein